jgi:uncharacterized protein YkwD
MQGGHPHLFPPMTRFPPVLTRRLPSRVLLVALLIVALAMGLVGPAGARTLDTNAEDRLIALTNKARAAHGLRPLAVDLQLTRVARDWSNTMATDRVLAHRPNLRSSISGNWTRIGENVGVGPSVERVQEFFMNSAGHRGNILGDYDRVGVGVYERNGRYWMTVNFLKGGGDAPVFTDVRSSTHRANIEGLFARGTTLGCSHDRFCPAANVTRGQMATFLARELGLAPRSNAFRDVPANHPHAGSIGALAAAGVTGGCGSGRFCPEERVNRGQMATFLQRALDLSARPPAGVADVPAGHTHAGAVGALQRAGITQGCSATRFCPTDGVTRGQMATFLQRSFA